MIRLIDLQAYPDRKLSQPDWVPLSSAQRALWLAYTLRPETQGEFNISLGMRVRPAIEAERLQHALSVLAARHAMLRARFREVQGQPMQTIHAQAVVPLRVVEVDDLDSPELVALERTERLRAIDIATAPPFKATLYSAGSRECVVSIVFDHLAFDGWSLYHFTQELEALLASEQTANPSTPDPKFVPGSDLVFGSVAALRELEIRRSIPAPARLATKPNPGVITRNELRVGGTSSHGAQPEFFEYVARERDWLQTPRAVKQLEYWRTTLAASPPCVEVPQDHRPASKQPEQRASLEHVLPGALYAKLKQLAAEREVTLFVVFLAAYAILLQRLSGEERISIGSVMPTRGERWRNTIGNFINPVVLPIAVRADMTLGELFESIHEISFRTLRNKDYPFEELTDQLGLRTANASSGYFKTFYAFQKARHAQSMAPIFARCGALGAIRWGDYEVEAFGAHLTSGASGQDLTLETLDFGECLCTAWGYDARRFDRATVQRLAQRWQLLLESMVHERGQPIAQLSWLTRAERECVLDWANPTPLALDERYVHEQFEAHAARTPDALALEYETTRLSYAELNARANRLAAQLRALGVGPEVRVGIGLERSIELVVALLATLKAGGAVVLFDAAYPAARLEYMLRDSAPEVVLTHAATHAALAPLAAPIPVLNLDTDCAAWAAAPSTNLDAPGLTPRSLAYVVYTSGSTGAPKGALNEHRGMSNLAGAQARAFGIGRSSRVLQFASPAFDASISEVAVTLTQGASLHLAQRADLMPGRALLTTLQRYGITHVTLPPAALPACEDPELPFTATTLIVAGEAIRLSEANKWASRLTLINAYGPSETSVCATVHRCTPGAAVVPIGRPIANARIYILDAARQPVPIGTAGEIYVGGVPVGRGYLHRAELTSERFVPDPFSGERMYKTGDLGRWLPDGNIEYLGRNDFQVKLRGFRIELGEIVASLSQIAGVADAVALVREDEPGDKRLVAYYCGSDAPSPAVLRARLGAELPQYMVPSDFIRLETLPVSPNGKLDRAALPPPTAAGAPERAYELPASPLERALARIWADVLRRERVGRDDDFFELGGHSLKAVELIARVRRELKIDVPLRALFARPVLADFASAMSAASDARPTDSNLVPLRPRGSLRPLFGVHPLGGTVEYLRLLKRSLDPQLPLYGLEASEHDELLHESIQDITARYVAAVRSVQPTGPYRLLGYSAGGVIAYAMAELLIAQDETVEFLGAIDSHPNLGLLPEFAELVERMERMELAHGADAADRLFLQSSLDYLLPAHVANASELFEQRALRSMRATLSALARYRPPRLPLALTLFAAQANARHDLSAEWRSFMGGRLRTIPIEGDHFSLLESHNIAALGRAITLALGIKRPATLETTSPTDCRPEYSPRSLRPRMPA